MITATANYFDGHDARRHPVELELLDGVLRVMGDTLTREYARAQVTLAERFAHAPTVLYFADGARCEVAANAGGPALADALGYRRSAVMRWQQHWYAALLALVLLIATGSACYVWGVPALSEKIAAALPPSIDQTLGANTLRSMEGKLLLQSRMSDQRIAQVRDVFASIVPAQPRVPVQLLVRDAPGLGPNALALPDGTIVVTDAMIQEILGKKSDFDEDGRAQLAGVLGHEIGHLEHRHSVRALARSSLVAAASASLFGDFSAVAAGVPAVLTNMRYSRDMEAEADNFAIALLRKKGISPEPLADLFDGLESKLQLDPQHDMPRWLSKSMAYMSSHPASAERSARIRKAAAEAEAAAGR
jgi:Zn-dependent protease with chaperone function